MGIFSRCYIVIFWPLFYKVFKRCNYIYKIGVLNMSNKTIDLNTLENDVMTALYKALDTMCFDRSGVDPENHKRTVSHNQLNYCFRMIYKNVFKPDQNQINNKKSIIDYENIEQLQAVADLFLYICGLYNKSLGLMSFSFMTGIDYKTIYNWVSDQGKKLNPERFQILKYIQESHKAAQIGLLNESPVGALAVANNDTETGLEWAAKQATTAQNNAVFLIPSERLQRLSITAHENSTTENE